MKKILSILAISVFLILAAPTYLLNHDKSTTLYSETTKDKYTSKPTPPSQNLKTYRNDDHNFVIEYPEISKSTEGKLIPCGKNIAEASLPLFPEEDVVMVDSIAMIRVISSNSTIADYIKDQGALGLYYMSEIFDSGADQGIAIDSPKNNWQGAGDPPLDQVKSIYKNEDKLILVSTPDSYQNEGCLNPKIVGNDPSINPDYELTNHLRFF